MNLGGESFAGLDPILVQKYQTVDANQGHGSSISGSYPWSLSTGRTTAPWNSYGTCNAPNQNGVTPSSGHHYDTKKEMNVSLDAQIGANSAQNASISSSIGASNVTQEYSSYVPYSSSTGQYMYNNNEYQNYYAYQQQPAASSSSSQAPQVGAGQNTGAPYHQSFTSFQPSGSYAASSSYSSTYYNPGDNQTTATAATTAGYPSNNYVNQTNYWNDGSSGSYPPPAPPHHYSSYPSSVANTQVASNAAANSHHYQQYSQWPYYYYPPASTGSSSSGPGSENMVAPCASAPAYPIQAPNGGYPSTNNQPPPPGTTSWNKEFGSSNLQGNTNATAYNVNSSQVSASGPHLHQINQMPSNFQMPTDSSLVTQQQQHQQLLQQQQLQQQLQQQQLQQQQQQQQQQPLLPPDNYQDQQNTTFPQVPNLQPPSNNQVRENMQPPLQISTMLDTRRVSNMQIPTNPRIASTLAFGMPKAEHSTSNAALKPAYISVEVRKPSISKSSSHDDAEAMMKGSLPASLRTFVERTFARCKDDVQRATNKQIMNEVMAKASADGTLFTRNWDIEPLFPLLNPTLDETGQSNAQISPSVSTFSKFKRSPNRRVESRWEPIADEKLVEKVASVNNDLSKSAERVIDTRKNGGKSSGWNGVSFLSSQQQTSFGKITHRPVKKPRFGDTTNVTPNGDASSDSDIEQSLSKYSASAIALADSPEEKKRREHRFKRFEKGQDSPAEVKQHRPKASSAGNIYTKRASAMMLAKNNEESCSRAVEDIDWDALTIKGTCQEIEKHYLRLTSAPDPATVRSEEVLEKALSMVQTSPKNYHYKCDQLKSIRQDITVQRIRNELTVKVYETHVRFALEAGDLSEYNKCQSQLTNLYAEGIKGCNMEFSAYNLLCVILHSNNKKDILSAMTRLPKKAKEDDAVKHALAVRSAVSSGNYILFFRLYKDAPNLNTSLMDLYVEKIRFNAIKCICKSYRPTLPVSYIAENLGFYREAQTKDSQDQDSGGLDKCEEWLRAHGAILIVDSNGELQLDAKGTSSTLYMPEPEDAVAHGDASLAVDAFLTRAAS